MCLNSQLDNINLKSKDFSFKNIHINLGKVRWYSRAYNNNVNEGSHKVSDKDTDTKNLEFYQDISKKSK